MTDSVYLLPLFCLEVADLYTFLVLGEVYFFPTYALGNVGISPAVHNILYICIIYIFWYISPPYRMQKVVTVCRYYISLPILVSALN